MSRILLSIIAAALVTCAAMLTVLAFDGDEAQPQPQAEAVVAETREQAEARIENTARNFCEKQARDGAIQNNPNTIAGCAFARTESQLAEWDVHN